MDDERYERFERLFRPSQKNVRAFFHRKGFRSDEVDDLTQDTFLRVFENMEGYRGGKPLAYLMTVAQTVWKNEIRHRRTIKAGERPLTLDDPENPTESKVSGPLHGPAPAGPDDDALRQERMKALSVAVGGLPPRMRQVLLLYVQGSRYREIAQALGVSLDTVKKQIFEGRRRLREELGEASVDDLFDRLDGEER